MALLNATDEDGAACVAERLRACVEVTPFQCGDRAIALTVSIGLACLADNEDGSSLFARADSALYEAKNKGRNGWNLLWCASANLTQ